MSGVIIAVIKGRKFDCAARRDKVARLFEENLGVYVIGSGYDLVTEELELELKVDGDNEDEIAEKLSEFVMQQVGLTMLNIGFYEQ